MCFGSRTDRRPRRGRRHAMHLVGLAGAARRKAKIRPDPARDPGESRAAHRRRDREWKKESAGKPGSVVDSHSSRPAVAARLKQPTRERRGPRQCSPIWSCSGWGLPCHAALSPRAVRSYRTVSPLPDPLRAIGGLFSVALSVGSRRPGVTWHPALWSPDFPRHSLDRMTRLSGRLRHHSTVIACAAGHCHGTAGRGALRTWATAESCELRLMPRRLPRNQRSPSASPQRRARSLRRCARHRRRSSPTTKR